MYRGSGTKHTDRVGDPKQVKTRSRKSMENKDAGNAPDNRKDVLKGFVFNVEN